MVQVVRNASAVALLCTGLAAPRNAQILYWTNDGSSVRMADVHSGATSIIISGLTGAGGIAVSESDQRLYWIDAGGVRTARLDGTDVRTVAASRAGLGTGDKPLAVDTTTRKLYFTVNGEIWRTDLPFGGNESLAVTSWNTASYEPNSRRFYRTGTIGSYFPPTVLPSRTVERIQADGTGAGIVVTDPARCLPWTSLTLYLSSVPVFDVLAQNLYFIRWDFRGAQSCGSLMEADLNGGGYRAVGPVVSSRVFAFDPLAKVVYWPGSGVDSNTSFMRSSVLNWSPEPFATTGIINDATLLVSCCPRTAEIGDTDWDYTACIYSDVICEARAIEHNCYNYATGQRTGHRNHPGDGWIQTCQTYTEAGAFAAAAADGLVPVGSPEACTSGCLVALYVEPGTCGQTGTGDYHWARLNLDGTWSHKLGWLPATLLQSTPPASILNYRFVSYFCVPCGWQDSTPGPGFLIPPDALSVEANRNTGTENPRVVTTDAELLSRLRTALASGDSTAGQSPTAFTGFILRPGSNLSDLPPVIALTNGRVVFPSSNGMRSVPDSGDAAAWINSVTFAGVQWDCAVRKLCQADVNCSAALTVQDIFDFLGGYFLGDPSIGDFNQSGAFSVQDIFDFLAAFFAGC